MRHSFIEMEMGTVFEVAVLVRDGWHVFPVRHSFERHERLISWCWAAGEDIILFDEDLDGVLEDLGGVLDEDLDGVVCCVIAILDKKRAAQFSLEFL